MNFKVHTFYYGWYGNPEYDGKYNNWNHPIIPHWRDTTWNHAGHFPGNEDIGANYYPALGEYSSNDPEIISQHMELIKEAGIGVLAISWWGPDQFTDKSVKMYLNLAQQFGLKLTFHIEPVYKSAHEFIRLLEYLHENYLDHPALFRYNGKPLYYIYDSGKVKYYEWNKMLSPEGELSIRNTPLDGLFIGHFERERDGGFILKSGFDGFYTYYASEGFMYGCTSTNWPVLAKFAKENNLLFIPCPGPGYIDTRIRPWNAKNTEDREGGKYYGKMFMNALNVNPDFIGITSFNEWHEGTQIEPAVPKTISTYTYENYGEAVDPMFYIKKTRELVNMYMQKVESNQ
ncbi:glycoside hydrolase family 99 protein [Prolixibacteraceae bacterium Z1-6]|uniref:Glycoside hydrolase family 99 protein n=1 Tax=Draconibacterium aestuarii TaxID=2998507 RepID=A0A9X3F1I4_9BACT|nr:glycoside hydrolase family 99 protein [Prolixibacteraceae bacterium Z1-6]